MCPTLGMDFFEQQERLYLSEIQQFPWMRECEMNLGTAENIAEAVDACIASGMYAYDCETTGLDRRLVDGVTKDKIVGFSISPDGRRSWYFPLRHQDTAANVPLLLAEKHLRRLFASPAKTIFFNANFDQEFAEFGSAEPLGTFEDTTKWEDGHLLSYLENSRRNSHGLKELSKVDLGCEMISLENLFPPDYEGKLDFSKLDPTSPPVVWYGCSDAIMHYRVFKEKERTVLACPRPQTVVYQIEKLCLLSVRWMQRNRVHVDKEIVKELLLDGKEEFRSALLEVYSFCCEALDRDIAPGYIRIWLGWPGPGQDFRSLGTPTPAPGESGSEGDEEMEEDLKEEFREAIIQSKWLGLDKVDKNKKFRQIVNASGKTVPEKYDIFSAQQLGLLLEELGIPGLVRTEKSGQIDTGDEELERLSKAYGDKYPFLGKLRRFRSLDKAFGTYLLALWKDTWDFDSTLNVQFKQAGTDTGRFKTPGPRDKNYREWGGTKYPLHGTPSPADDSKPNCLRYVRRVFTPRKVPGQRRVLVAVDESGVELRIVTNISGEPLWLDEYFRCSTCELTFDRGDGKSTPAAPPNFCPRCGSDRIGDLHTLSGIAFFGEEATKKDNWKQLRGWAKQVNFALCYGGSGKTVQDGIGCDEAEGARIHHKFNSTYKGLAAWWESIVQFGQTHGYVTSAFGRKYSVEDLNLPITPDKEPDPRKREMNKKFRAKAKRNAINGPIQATSADLIKIAMGRIYKEVFKRGWQDLMCMTITMHDELVFEIDLSILADALPMIQHEMTRCKAILGLGWRVPLLTDCEIGLDWTVPWDFKDLVYGRVRPDGVVIDEKGQPIKESKKARWPDWLLAAFPEAKFPRAGQQGAQGSPAGASQEIVEYTLPAMDESTIQWLAGVIHETAYPGKGALLKLKAPLTGEVIPLLEELRVDPGMFRKIVSSKSN